MANFIKTLYKNITLEQIENAVSSLSAWASINATKDIYSSNSDSEDNVERELEALNCVKTSDLVVGWVYMVIWGPNFGMSLTYIGKKMGTGHESFLFITHDSKEFNFHCTYAQRLPITRLENIPIL